MVTVHPHCPKCGASLESGGVSSGGEDRRCLECGSLLGISQASSLSSEGSEETVDVPPDHPDPRGASAKKSWHEIPGYAILGELGHGGMGVVYKARQVSLGRLVALKMILAGAHARPEVVARFRAEAKTIAQLQHTTIVQVHEVGEHDGLQFLSLEFVKGTTLAKRLASDPQPGRAAAELVEMLARAVAVAHQRGIIHRHLKPSNILLALPPAESRDPLTDQTNAEALYGIPKISDFGLAKQLDSESDDQGQTYTGCILGTPAYMAPEQASGNSADVGPAVDIHALGVILYEMLTGHPPFKV
jgi:serine/threonine protein kinase